MNEIDKRNAFSSLKYSMSKMHLFIILDVGKENSSFNLLNFSLLFLQGA